MRNSVLLLSLVSVACMPVPGLEGRSGPEGQIGPSGEAGSDGRTGIDGTDPAAREASIAYVIPDRLMAGQDLMVQVVGNYTDWSEGADIEIDYPGIEVLGTQVLGPITLGLNLRVSEDVRSGVASLTIGDLVLPTAFHVEPAAWFEFAEGQSNPVSPGSRISGTIYLNTPHGVDVWGSGGWGIDILGTRGGLILESGLATGDGVFGYQKVTFEGRLAPHLSAGPKSLAIMRGPEVQIPVAGALEIADLTLEALALDQTVEGSLADGDAYYSLDLEAGQTLRFSVTGPSYCEVGGELCTEDADCAEEEDSCVQGFVPSLNLNRPPVEEDDPMFFYTNEQPELSAVGQALELIVPKSGAWYLTVTTAEELAEGVEAPFSLALGGFEVTPAPNSQHRANLASAGHGAWFASPVAEGNLIGWRINAPDDSEASPVGRLYFTGNANDQDFVGLRMLRSSDPRRYVYESTSHRNAFGLNATLTGQFIWRVFDRELGGGEGYDVDFSFVANANGGALCADLEGLPITIPRDELGDVSVLGRLDQTSTDLGSMGCALANPDRADLVYKLVLTQPRRLSYHLQTQGGDNGGLPNWQPMLAIETECGNTETEISCSGPQDGTDFDGEAVAATATAGTTDLQPGTYVIRVQHQDAPAAEYRFSFWLDLRLAEIP